MGTRVENRHSTEINPNRNKYDVSCKCGWRSAGEPNRNSAVMMAHLHIVESCLQQGV